MYPSKRQQKQLSTILKNLKKTVFILYNLSCNHVYVWLSFLSIAVPFLHYPAVFKPILDANRIQASCFLLDMRMFIFQHIQTTLFKVLFNEVFCYGCVVLWQSLEAILQVNIQISTRPSKQTGLWENKITFFPHHIIKIGLSHKHCNKCVDTKTNGTDFLLDTCGLSLRYGS